jgi:hypothetical protein
MDHLHRMGACPFEIDKAFNVPILVNKNVGLVKICEIKEERASKEITAEKARPDASHNHQSGCLIEAIFNVIGCVRLVAKPTFMECEDVINIRVDSGISHIPRHVDWDVLIFQLMDFQGQRPVIQAQVPVLIYSEGADLW